MSFYVKVTDFDLGTIEIENIFINDFMPSADGLYVKVYLMGLKLAEDYKNSKKIDNFYLSKILNVPLNDVINAWNYWESKSIIIKHFPNKSNTELFDVEFVSLRQLYINQNYYNPENSKDLILKTVKDESFKNLFKRIDSNITHELQPNERYKLMEFLEKNPVDDNLVIEAFNSLKRGAYTSRINTVIKRLFNWKDLNIRTLEELEKYKFKTNERYIAYKTILSALGYPWQDPNSGDKEVINKWIDEYNFTVENILAKIKEVTKKKRNPHMNYLDAVFTSIYNGVDYKKDEKKEIKPQKKSNRFHNFSSDNIQMTEDELERKLIKNITKGD